MADFTDVRDKFPDFDEFRSVAHIKKASTDTGSFEYVGDAMNLLILFL